MQSLGVLVESCYREVWYDGFGPGYALNTRSTQRAAIQCEVTPCKRFCECPNVEPGLITPFFSHGCVPGFGRDLSLLEGHRSPHMVK